MELTDRIEKALAEEEKKRRKDPNFQTLRDFYEAMKKDGIAIKQSYTLPPFDTVGRRRYETTASKTNPKK